MRRPLIILGTSGLAREMAMLAEQIDTARQRWELMGFIGERMEDAGKQLAGVPILGDDQWLLDQDFAADLVIGIGYPKVRAKVLRRYLAQGDRFQYPNLIHPSAVFDGRRVALGRGNVITAGCIFTCEISVGDFNLFNWNTTVGHDASIGSYNVMNPSVNVSGWVRLGDRILVGTGCQILENIQVQSDSVLGAGAVVRAAVASGQTVVGVPGKPLQRS